MAASASGLSTASWRQITKREDSGRARTRRRQYRQLRCDLDDLHLLSGRIPPADLKSVGHGGRVVSLANVALAPSIMDTRDFYPKNARILGFQITNLIERASATTPGPT